MYEADNTSTPLGFCSTDQLATLVRARCKLNIPPHLAAGCCTWDTFLDGFCDAWPKWFDVPPNDQQWRMAKRDWVAGNTGWEAAHNAQRRIKERVQKLSGEAWATASGVLTKAARG